MEEEDWAGTWIGLSSGTQGYLDSAAVELTRLGLPSYRSGTDLLQSTFDRFFSLEGEMTMVLVQGSVAEVMLHRPSGGSADLRMLLEETDWRLDIRQAYADSIRGVFSGSCLPAGPLSEPQLDDTKSD